MAASSASSREAAARVAVLLAMRPGGMAPEAMTLSPVTHTFHKKIEDERETA